MAEVKLIVLDGPLKGKDFILDKEITIGRLAKNNISIEDDTISRTHSRIKTEGGKFILTDLGSQNGTFVNGARIQETALKNGDEIRIGDSLFKFEQKMPGDDEDTFIETKGEKKSQGTQIETPEASNQTTAQGTKQESEALFDPGEFLKERVLEKPLVLTALLVIFLLLVLYLFLPFASAPPRSVKISQNKGKSGRSATRVEEVLSQTKDPKILIEKAQESIYLAKSLYTRRRVKHDNLFKAIKKFEEAVGLMQGLDPKPDIYTEATTSLEETRKTLDKEFQDTKFMVEQSIKLKDYSKARNEAKTIMDMIPDQKDERYKYAEKRYKQLERALLGGKK